DKQPPMTMEGKQALFDYVRGGHGFIGTHAASDTFHTNGEDQKGPDRYLNHGEKADAYVRFLGGEFIKHGAQQVARNKVTDPTFPTILVGGIKWAIGEVTADVPPNLKEVAPDAFTNPPYPAPKPATASLKAN